MILRLIGHPPLPYPPSIHPSPSLKLEPFSPNEAPASGSPLARFGRAPRVALIGNHPPRRCGIATFTRDVADGLEALGCPLHLTVMDDGGTGEPFPPRIATVVDARSREAHARAGRAIADWEPDAVLVQHEYGIFGGPSGAWLLDMLAEIDAPVVATLHTVLRQPSPPEAAALAALAERADRLIVMARTGARILARGGEGWAGIDPSRIVVVPHGTPDRPFEPPAAARNRIGWDEVPTVLTFGLLSPGKGIEQVIDALPTILRAAPEARYVLLGATHPHLLAREGERYREALVARAGALGVSHALRMIPRFVDQAELCDALAAADVYVTPYGNPAQITSGTLAYALALGKPVISTPYAHACEVLPPEQLVPHGDAAAMGERIAALLADPVRLDAIARRTWRDARFTVWPAVARQTLNVLREVVAPAPALEAAE